MFLGDDNVSNGLSQAYTKLAHEGLDLYTIMGIGDGGKHIVEGLLE
ncbi:MAG: hypothetical protein LAKADJCE_00845 [Candidatus Argoarchaeum ethanivorans]|uniref:Uncharacterized protein n=1 Tax=Candidatus Argoarchaeum ethanivorans TaxID=2608793 RepID=A0A811TID7_9EURY|nr:MAG: hypothetical protein LAKADJCE_00845 [Candidatus Argoarchaeum ethanivorans]